MKPMAERLQKVLEKAKFNYSEEEYNKHQKDEWWFFAEEALEKGVCDEIAREFV